MTPARALIALLLSAGLAPAAAADPISYGSVQSAAGCVIAADSEVAANVAWGVPVGTIAQTVSAQLDAPQRRCLAASGIAHSAQARRLLAGAIAEQLYRDHFPAPPPLRLAGPATARPNEQELAMAEAAPLEIMLADCLVVRRPAAADRLMRSAPASVGESTALGQVLEVRSSCLDAGEAVTLDRGQWRALLASALYRRVMGPE